ncbi:hypothetical protein [Candidatus Albibeggiatoa sp. nov. BB20]|uniref:hypothetical protein n=1 Tax=Candidatus Albibeggiatoa sp. nov. BB20 TaxID=3162723 RepID=UPI00336543C0
MIFVKEDKLCFAFPSDWQVIKYDGDRGFYREKIQKSQGMSAVDIIATDGTELLFFEIKDIRGHSEKNRPRLSPKALPEIAACQKLCKENRNIKIIRKKPYLGDEIAKNVKDTLLGLVSANYDNNPELKPYYQAIAEKQPLRIILFLVQDEIIENNRDTKRALGLLSDKIKQCLQFIDIEVSVLNQQIMQHEKWKVSDSQ